MKKTIVIGIAIILLAIVAFFVVKNVSVKLNQTKQKPPEAVYTVGVLKAKKSILTETITGHSIIEGNPQVKVYTSGDVSGLFIRNLFKEGDFVKKGNVIAYVDRNSPGNNYSEVPVTSPIDGVITKLYFIDKGTKVASTDPLAEIANIDTVKLNVNLGSSDIVKVKKDQKVIITSDFMPNLKINAKVTSVTPFIDTDSLSGNVTIFVDNKNRKLEVGLSANVEIQVAERMAYAVPDNAVLVSDNTSYIFINNNNIAKQIFIKTGYTNNGITEIFGKIKDGDEIINDGNFKLKDGDKIKVIYE
jgi:membrane fusion protein, multidrug efflux system